MYQKLIVFVQALAAVGILVIAVITWMGQSTTELRIEMQEEFKAVRTEMHSFRSEMKEEHADIRADIHDMNTRLGRVEGKSGL